MTLGPEDCIIDSFFGNTHPYNYCISPASEVIKDSKNRKDCDIFGNNCIKDNIIGFGKYLGSLFIKPDMILDNKCKDIFNKNKLGNKYVMKTSSKCIDKETNDLVDRYVYINNTDNSKIFGVPMLPDDSGILPASLSKATRINGAGLFYALIEEDTPICEKVKVKCHLLDKYKRKYSGPSPYVYIASKDLDDIGNNRIIENFNNLNDNNLNDNNLNDNNLNDNNNLNDIYYILLSIILLYIIFKIIQKK